MCAAAMSFARIRRLYYGAADPKGGAVENGVRFFASPTCHHRPEVYGGIDEKRERGAAEGVFPGAPLDRPVDPLTDARRRRVVRLAHRLVACTFFGRLRRPRFRGGRGLRRDALARRCSSRHVTAQASILAAADRRNSRQHANRSFTVSGLRARNPRPSRPAAAPSRPWPARTRWSRCRRARGRRCPAGSRRCGRNYRRDRRQDAGADRARCARRKSST